MKLKLSLFLLLICSFSTMAQRTANIALSGGVVNYIGDLGNEKLFPYSSAKTGASVTIRDFINNPKYSGTRFSVFDMQLRFSWHRLEYDEARSVGNKKGLELRNYQRGIGFRNDLFGSEVDFTYNIYPNLYAPLNKQKISFFFLAGVGVFYGQPKADLFNGSQSLSNRYYAWKDGSIRDAAENSKGIGNVIEKDGNYETIINLASDGSLIWSKSYVDFTYRWTRSIKADNLGNFYIMGTYESFGPSPSVPASTFIQKIDANGNFIFANNVTFMSTHLNIPETLFAKIKFPFASIF